MGLRHVSWLRDRMERLDARRGDHEVLVPEGHVEVVRDDQKLADGPGDLTDGLEALALAPSHVTSGVTR
jgi:hypothetical protein